MLVFCSTKDAIVCIEYKDKTNKSRKWGEAKTVLKRKQKKRFLPMEITRIKLNPEQAVLSCCDASSKVHYGWSGPGVPNSQCYTDSLMGTPWAVPGCGTAVWEMSS